MHVFKNDSFSLDKIDRCGAAKDAQVITPLGAGKILTRRIKNEVDAYYEYFVMLENGTIKVSSMTTYSFNIQMSGLQIPECTITWIAIG